MGAVGGDPRANEGSMFTTLANQEAATCRIREGGNDDGPAVLATVRGELNVDQGAHNQEEIVVGPTNGERSLVEAYHLGQPPAKMAGEHLVRENMTSLSAALAIRNEQQQKTDAGVKPRQDYHVQLGAAGIDDIIQTETRMSAADEPSRKDEREEPSDIFADAEEGPDTRV